MPWTYMGIMVDVAAPLSHHCSVLKLMKLKKVSLIFLGSNFMFCLQIIGALY